MPSTVRPATTTAIDALETEADGQSWLDTHPHQDHLCLRQPTGDHARLRTLRCQRRTSKNRQGHETNSSYPISVIIKRSVSQQTTHGPPRSTSSVTFRTGSSRLQSPVLSNSGTAFPRSNPSTVSPYRPDGKPRDYQTVRRYDANMLDARPLPKGTALQLFPSKNKIAMSRQIQEPPPTG